MAKKIAALLIAAALLYVGNFAFWNACYESAAHAHGWPHECKIIRF